MIPASGAIQKAPAEARQPVAVTANHWKVVEWMKTQAFRDIVAVHQTACGNRASIYFRPTDNGLVRIGLHPLAPGYVGFRTHSDDGSFLVPIGSPVPTPSEVEAQLKAFEVWISTVNRRSDEEQGVIPWIGKALEHKLWLPDLGEGWLFLNQEWRFTDKGKAKKTDVLAVHGPTGQLGIVEFKSNDSAIQEACSQVADYSRLWDRDAHELAPFFTTLLHAMCAAYGNDSEGSTVSVSTGPAALFVGVASRSGGTRILKC